MRKVLVFESLSRSAHSMRHLSQQALLCTPASPSGLLQGFTRNAAAAFATPASFHTSGCVPSYRCSTDGISSTSNSSTNSSSSSSLPYSSPPSCSVGADALTHRLAYSHCFSVSGIVATQQAASRNPLSSHTPTPAWLAHVHQFSTSSKQPTPNRSPQRPPLDAQPAGRKRGTQTQQEHGEDTHPPGSERWNVWLQQLQLAGLSQEQAFTSLSSTPSLLKQAPDNKAADFKKLIAILTGESDLTAEQFRQIVMHYPQIMRITHKGGLLGNINWFRNMLDVDASDWVELVLGCRPLITLRVEGLQARFDALLEMGLDPEDVRECWLQTPELLKLSAEAMQAKVEILQALFPRISIAKVLRSDPEALLQGSGNLRDRAMFLKQLGGIGRVVVLSEVLQGGTDMEFALLAAEAHIASSGKSLAQLCGELQAQPGVREYMAASNVHPDTMTAYKYFLVVVMFSKSSRDPSGAPAGF